MFANNTWELEQIKYRRVADAARFMIDRAGGNLHLQGPVNACRVCAAAQQTAHEQIFGQRAP